jgi:chromosome segregation ATPase
MAKNINNEGLDIPEDLEKKISEANFYLTEVKRETEKTKDLKKQYEKDIDFLKSKKSGVEDKLSSAEINLKDILGQKKMHESNIKDKKNELKNILDEVSVSKKNLEELNKNIKSRSDEFDKREKNISDKENILEKKEADLKEREEKINIFILEINQMVALLKK